MSDNRKRPIARRFKPETEALLQVYAKSRNITANEAAEQLLHGNAGVVVDAAAEIKKLRAAVTRAENVAAAREKQRDDALADLAAERVTAGVLRDDLESAREATEALINGAAGEIAALDAALVATRAELESAREATRRADAEIERLEADLTTAGEDLEAERRSDEAAHDAFRAEIDRLTRELAEAKRTTDKLRIEVERVTEERDTERRLDVAAQEALRADVAREIAANRKLEAELAETRAALATKGAIAVDVDRRACACALPDDLAPRLAAIAARRDVAPDVMLANVIKNGISKIEASDKYQDAQKAARARS